MMRIFILFCILLYGCALPKFSSNYPDERNKIDTLCVIEPIVNYIIIDSKKTYFRDSTLNDSISKAIDTFLNDKIQYFDSIRINYTMQIDTNNYIELGQYCNYLEKGWRREFSNYRIPENIRILIDSIPQNYILLTYLDGFELSKKFYTKRLIGDLTFTLLTLGYVARTTYPKRYRMNLMLIDKTNNQLLFYNNHWVNSECTPYNYKCMENSIYQCFYKFY